MKKIILIIIVVVIVAVLGIFAWLYFQSPSTVPPVNEPTPIGALPGAGTSTAAAPASAQGATIDIGTPQGIVTVSNVYKTITSRDEEYVTFAIAPSYQLFYDTDNSSFVVDITAGPLVTTRPTAEAAFLATLGVSQADACKLAVTVGVESSVDPAFEHQALRLSFCN